MFTDHNYFGGNWAQITESLQLNYASLSVFLLIKNTLIVCICLHDNSVACANKE